jgi:hypothetical protein
MMNMRSFANFQKLRNSDEILVDVDLGDDGQVLDDDGCGDGRGVGKTFSKLNPGFKRSLNRAKVFGGSVAMTVASEIANSEADENLLSAYTTAISSLRSKMIDFGGHTDNHAHGNNCGCGAIDKAPVIINAASKYSGQISEVMVGALGINNDLTNAVLAKYDDYGQRMKTDNYSGSAVMENIIESGVVVKELEDDHKEIAVVLNMVDGKTINQAAIREVSGGKAQVFAVDVWRLKSISERLYGSAEDQGKAFASMIVYTLATAAILTKGNLPVYLSSED